MNKLMLNIMGSLGEYERTILKDNIRIGASNKASEGKSVGGQPPYGYDRIDGLLIVNQHESRIVKEIYQMYSQGMNFTAIAKVLNDRHEVTKLGKPHSKDSVSYILKNKVYRGLVVYNQYVDWKKKVAKDIMITLSLLKVNTKLSFLKNYGIKFKHSLKQENVINAVITKQTTS